MSVRSISIKLLEHSLVLPVRHNCRVFLKVAEVSDPVLGILVNFNFLLWLLNGNLATAHHNGLALPLEAVSLPLLDLLFLFVFLLLVLLHLLLVPPGLALRVALRVQFSQLALVLLELVCIGEVFNLLLHQVFN